MNAHDDFIFFPTADPPPTPTIRLIQGDCLTAMPSLDDHSIDLILCDLPYQLTNWTNPLHWDKLLPLDQMWQQYWRILKPNRPIVLFCNEPNATKLRMSALDCFKYNWIWRKTKIGGIMNAKVRPLKCHETILVFSQGTTSPGRPNNMPYYPQGLSESGKIVKNTKSSRSVFSDRPSIKDHYVQQFTGYPVDVLEFESVERPVHPTQKPVALLDYLIRTYSNIGDVVLDNCMGSGSTGLAARQSGRDFIGIEQDKLYYDIAYKRILHDDT